MGYFFGWGSNLRIIFMTFPTNPTPDFQQKLRKLSRRAFLVWKKMPNPPKRPLSWLTMFLRGQPIWFTIAYRQNINNLMRKFGAIHVGIMHAKFKASGVGGEWGDRHTRDVRPGSYTKFLNFPLRFALDGINKGGLMSATKTSFFQRYLQFFTHIWSMFISWRLMLLLKLICQHNRCPW